MPGSPAHEALFLDNLALIERIIGSVCRRHSLGGADADDFGSWVKLRLIEDEYAALRKFRSESAIGTYLTVVIAFLFRGYRVQQWGKWRPSAEAKRRGEVALRLEALVYRHGHSVGQAAELLRTSGETTQSDRELAVLLGQLPARLPMRPVDAGREALVAVEAAEQSDAGLSTETMEASRASAEEAIRVALDRMEPEDRLIIRMRFWNDLGVADIARGLGLPQKPLYRRIEGLLRQLRVVLTESGVSQEQARDLLGELL